MATPPTVPKQPSHAPLPAAPRSPLPAAPYPPLTAPHGPLTAAPRSPLTAAAILLALAAQIAFIAVDRRTFSYDDAWYAESALRLSDAWTQHGLAAGYEHFVERTLGGQKAPLVLLAPQPLIAIFGRYDFVFPLANALTMAAASAVLAAVIRRGASDGAAAAGVLLFSLMPMTNLVIRQFFTEPLLTLLVGLTVYHGLHAHYFASRRHALLLGLALGLGVLAKVTFPVYVVGLALCFAIDLLRRGAAVAIAMLLAALLGAVGPAAAVLLDAMHAPHALLIALGVTALIAVLLVWRPGGRRANVALATMLALWTPLPWYLHNFKVIAEFAYQNSVGSIARDYTAPIAAFWMSNLNFGIGVASAFGLGAAVLLLALVAWKRARPGQPAAWLLLTAIAWFAPAAVAFTLGTNRTTRFLAPVLPALGVVAALAIDQIARRVRPLAWVAAAAMLAPAIIAFVVFTLGGPTLQLGPHHALTVWSAELTSRGPLTTVGYPLGAVVAAAAQVAPRDLPRDALGMMLSDTVCVNQNTLSYAAVRDRRTVTFGLAPYGVTLDAARADLARADFLLFQDGGSGFPDLTNQNARPLREELRGGALAGFRAIDQPTVALPDGGLVRFAIRERPDAAHAESTNMDAGAAPFRPAYATVDGGAFALVGVALEASPEGLRLGAAWVKLRPDARALVIAAHLVDAGGGRTNFDHGPAGGGFASAAVGQSITAWQPLPAAAVAQAVRVELQLYDPAAGRGLPSTAHFGVSVVESGWISLDLPR